MTRLALVGPVVLFALLAPGQLLAQTPPADEAATEPSAADVATARELFKDAAALAQEGKWEEALDRYQRSMALRPSPLTRYSIAVAQSHTGRLLEASENIRTFFHEATPDLQPYVQPAEDLLRSIEPRIARLTIRIPGDPRGARVLIDGQELPLAAVGVERLINPGKHRVEATVPGHAPFFEQLDLTNGASKTVLVTLSRDVTTAPAAGSAPPSDSSGRRSSMTGKILVGAGGTVFVVGGVFGAIGWSEAKNSPTRDGDQADKAKRFALIGDIGMGAGLIAAGVGTYLLLSAPSEPRGTALMVSPWTTGHAGGVGMLGRF